MTRLSGRSGTGGVLGGILGGVAAHLGANAAGPGPMLGDTAMMAHIRNFLEGGIGGGTLAAIAGAVMKKS
ncbi:MAG: hypothetical protein WEA77_00445 [Hyphomonas sp.]|uniref:hypothetical protein n=1 Tax=Hyphomonas sp. TaxID=87 RepID=UPI0034A09DF0